MQVTHENILSHLYKFEKLKTELIKLRKNFNDTTVSDIKNKASSIDLSRWEDIISAKVETKVDDLKTKVIPSIGSSISKDFEEMVGMSVYIVSNTEAYAADKETYENIKKEISSLESSISNQSTETEEGRQRLSSLNEQLATEREKLDKAWAELEKDLNNVNFLLNAIANIRFVPGSSGDNGDTGGNDNKGDAKAALNKAVNSNNWKEATVMTKSGDKTTVFTTTVDGVEVNATVTKEGTVLFYSTIDASGNLTWYDSSMKVITLEQRTKLLNEYNNW